MLEKDKCQQLVLCIYDELNPLTGIAHVAYPAGTVHLSEHCIPVSSADTHQHLRSANRHLLAVPRFPLNTYDRQAFSVAGLELYPRFYPGSNEQHKLFSAVIFVCSATSQKQCNKSHKRLTSCCNENFIV